MQPLNHMDDCEEITELDEMATPFGPPSTPPGGGGFGFLRWLILYLH